MTSFLIFNIIFIVKLFGEDDPDQDVSPDTEDPEAEGDKAGQAAADKEANKVPFYTDWSFSRKVWTGHLELRVYNPKNTILSNFTTFLIIFSI